MYKTPKSYLATIEGHLHFFEPIFYPEGLKYKITIQVPDNAERIEPFHYLRDENGNWTRESQVLPDWVLNLEPTYLKKIIPALLK